MKRLLFAAAVAGLLAVPTVNAAKPQKPEAAKPQAASAIKPLEMQLFEQLLKQHQDMTFDQLRAKAVKPRDYPAGLSFDPTKASYFDTLNKKFRLTDDELGIFKRTGLVSLDLNRRYSFASAYYEIYTSDLPVFVSTDSIMHALHKSYDDILMDMEVSVFSPAIAKILADVHEEVGKRAGQDKIDTNAADVDLYVTVARNLLAGGGSPPEDKDPFGKPTWDGTLKFASKFQQDEKVLELIKGIQSLKLHHPGMGDPPVLIYGGERYPDFSQFKPRGHYTKSQALKNYFRTMMWLGRVDTGWNVLPTAASTGLKANSDRELQDALLFCEFLKAADGVKSLKAVDEIIGFMVGKSDNLTVFQLLDVVEKTGVKLTEARDADKLEKVKAEIKTGKHGDQMIRSQVVLSDPNTTVKAPIPSVFQVFGQRFIMDSFVLSQVVFDSILFKNEKQKRMMPMGLDVMASLGNDEALNLLEPELTKWNYSANLMAARDFVNLHPPAYWKSNLYVLWLDCLRALHADMSKEKRFPEAMRTKAWQMKQLQTQLASWSELRHDTILYAKQSYTAGTKCEYPAGYVEPYPEFYARVKYFANEAERLFTAAEFPGGNPAKQRYVAFFKRMGDIVGKMETLAKKELAGEPFTADEKAFLKKTVDRRGGGSGPPRYDGWYTELFYHSQKSPEWTPTVADVHTDPDSRSCLEVAVGDAMLGVIAINNDGDKMVFVGPLYSYYEFRQPVGNRLTDEQWAEMIAGGKLPPRPNWTNDFVAPTRKAGGR